MKDKGFWTRFFALFSALQLLVALLVGMAGSYLLGSVLGMGWPGHALGFVLGIGLVMGWGALDFD